VKISSRERFVSEIEIIEKESLPLEYVGIKEITVSNKIK
jgi:hypothetical protein